MNEPALAMIEFKSVARGIVTTDAMAKKAPIRILGTHPVCPGKYMVLFCGEVADVEESLGAGMAVGGDLVVNELFLPHVHASVIPALSGTTDVESYGAVAVVETFSIASCGCRAVRAAKTAPIKLIEIRLANGLGGKGYFVMTGELPDVEASLASAREFVSEEGMLAASEIIPRPHPELLERGLYW